MTTTPRHGITELNASQANAEVLHNEGVSKLEQGCSIFSVENDTLTAPPGSEPDGAAYIINGTPTGAWSAHSSGDIVFAIGASAANGWRRITPWIGCLAWDKADNHWLRWDGTVWQVGSAITALTDNTAGGDTNSVEDVGPTFSQTTLNNNFASIAADLSEIRTAIQNFGIIT